MVPSLLFAAALAQQADKPIPSRVVFFERRDELHWNGATHIPIKYPVLVWGDPPHLRGYPWGGDPPAMIELPLPKTVRLAEKPVKSAPPTPADPRADKIKALEWSIAALQANGGSQESINQLQKELDAIKKSDK